MPLFELLLAKLCFRIFTSWCREHKIGLENEQFNSVSSIENPQDLLTGEIGTDDCFYN